MPSTPQITLDVRNFATNAPGWTNVQGSNNQTYSYSYTGGDDGAGGRRDWWCCCRCCSPALAPASRVAVAVVAAPVVVAAAADVDAGC